MDNNPTKKDKKNTGRGPLRGLLLVLLLLLLFAGVSCARCLPLLWQNLTVGKLPLSEEEEWTGGRTYRAVPYAELSPAQYLDLYVPEGIENPPLFVLIHGGGFVAGDSDTRQVQFMYRYFRDHGYACASVNYRLAQEAPFPAAIEDCKAAIRFLRANAEVYGYEAEHLAVFGESAGGYLASMCAFTSDEEFSDLPFIGQTEENNPSSLVDCLVDYYPHLDPLRKEDLKEMGVPRWVYLLANNWLFGNTGGFEEFESYWLRKNWSQMSEEERAKAHPFSYLEQNAPLLSNLRVYLIHGDADLTVPYASSLRLKEALDASLGSEKTLFCTGHGMGHASDPLYREEILAEIEGFLQN